MKSIVRRMQVVTAHEVQLIDVTEMVRAEVAGAGIQEGVVFITTVHTTTGITVNECLPDVEADLVGMLERLVPERGDYLHARYLAADGAMAINSPSHQRAALLGMQVAFPVEGGEVSLGTRQSIYFAELDGPLPRTFIVHIVGE